MKLEEYVTSQSTLSRRKLLDLVKQGKVMVNGNIVKQLQFQLTSTDIVKVDNKQIKRKHTYHYFKLNKPKGVLTTLSDTKGRKCIGDLIAKKGLPLVPVGRLDRQTTGLLFLTNDGDFAYYIAHPTNKINKIYNVTLNKKMTKMDLKRLEMGVILEDGPFQAKKVVLLQDHQLQLTISEGRNRIIRRVCQCLGYEVISLKRIAINNVELGGLASGDMVALSEKQLRILGYRKGA